MFYIVAQIRIDDPEGYAAYQDGFLPIFAQFEGEILAVSDDVNVLEGDWPYSRAVVIRIPSEEKARAWYASPEYLELAKIRHAASEGTIISFQDFQAHHSPGGET